MALSGNHTSCGSCTIVEVILTSDLFLQQIYIIIHSKIKLMLQVTIHDDDVHFIFSDIFPA